MDPPVDAMLLTNVGWIALGLLAFVAGALFKALYAILGTMGSILGVMGDIANKLSAYDQKLNAFGEMLDMTVTTKTFHATKTGTKLHKSPSCAALTGASGLVEIGATKTSLDFLQHTGALCTLCGASTARS